MSGYTSNQNFGILDEQSQQIENNPNRKIPYEKCIEILEDCKEMGVKAIQFTGGGEPTTHPDHPKIFQKVIDLGMDLALITNGAILKPDVIETLVHAKWVRVSVDAGTPETYSHIRSIKKERFNDTLKNISRLVDAKAKSADTDLLVGVGYVVDQNNFGEIHKLAKIVSEMGVDNIRIGAIFTPKGFKYYDGIYSTIVEQIQRTKDDFQSDNFTIFDAFKDRIDDLVHESPDYNNCGYMHFDTYIGGDLKVYSCCNNAYSTHGEMGSINNQSFKEFWNSDEKKLAYNSLKALDCERCMFNAKNKFINYLLAEDPVHVNFV
jgi:MoaA/NifB/PqqE/SkfB family radical SAM enzyme